MPAPGELSRRSLLVGASLGALGLVIGGGKASAQAASNYAATSPGDWAALQRSLSGRLLLPSDAAYATARLPWNTIYDSVAPLAVVQPRTTADVQTTITFCRDTGIKPTARSGGHSFQGFSTGTGLLIDMSAMNRVTLNRSRSRARIGAGALLIDIYRELFNQGRMAINGGTCPLVGISGLTQGGGVGPFSREHGLTLDRLVGANIVTADGKARRVSNTENADLFWALRGGGGGNFGVVTSFDFVPVPADMVINSFVLEFEWRHALPVLEAFQSWPDALPASAHPNIVLVTSTSAPGAQPTVNVSLWYRGSRRMANAVINDFIREVGAKPRTRTLLRQNFFEAEYDEYCQGFTTAQCAPVTSPGGLLPRVGLSTYSDISNRPWPSSANEVLLDELERWQRDPVLQPAGVDFNLQAGKIIIEPLSGAVHDTPADATAFPHRDGWMIYQFQSRVAPGAPADVVAAGQEWVNRLYQRLTPWRTGSEYSNYGNRELKRWGAAYYGANFPRLRTVKDRYDPTNLFHFEQSVPRTTPVRHH